jgi:hypothetical protein
MSEFSNVDVDLQCFFPGTNRCVVVTAVCTLLVKVGNYPCSVRAHSPESSVWAARFFLSGFLPPRNPHTLLPGMYYYFARLLLSISLPCFVPPRLQYHHGKGSKPETRNE